MSAKSYMGIPREDIPWFPTIDAEKCTNCGECIEFCTNDVLAAGETSTQVVNPLNCVVGCASCTRICPANALSFPDQKEFVETLKRLREQYAHR